jgi:hypothetical protein
MAYAQVLDVARLTGLFEQVINESVGTGTGLVAAFSLDHINVVEGSETVTISDVTKTRGVDYNINNSSGSLTFLTNPANGAVIKSDYKYYPKSVNIANSDITAFIADADNEVEEWTGKKWTSLNSYTEYIQGRAEKITVQGSKEYGQYSTESQGERYVIMLSKYPVQAITSLQFLKDDGTVDVTLVENTDFHWWPDGKVQVITQTLPIGLGKKKIKAVYTYGSADPVPRNVKNLSSAIAGIMLFSSVTGGSFDDARNYTLGPMTVAVEDMNITIAAALKKLEDIRDRIFEEIGRELRHVVI